MTETNYALTHLYHPTGAKVDVPLSLFEELTVTQAGTLVRSVDALLMAGFTISLPGLNDGENFEQIGFAVKRSKENADGTTTPVMDVYPVTGNFRILGLYLNTQAEVLMFEQATGLRIASMPMFDGAPIERGAKTATDKYVVALAAPAKVVWKQNQQWEGENDKKHAKRSFVRWDGLRPVTTPEPEPEMTLEKAFGVLTPGGKKMSGLTDEQLLMMINTTALNATAEMKKAAETILSSKNKEK